MRTGIEMSRTFELPTTYEQWHKCITVHCGIDLTHDFARQRINALGDPKSAEAKKFATLYGDAHRTQVVNWFQRASS
jgi:hypothetical protein